MNVECRLTNVELRNSVYSVNTINFMNLINKIYSINEVNQDSGEDECKVRYSSPASADRGSC